MSDAWLRMPSRDVNDPLTGETEARPKYSHYDGVEAYSGQRIGNSPQWVVRVFADDATLDEIAAKDDVDTLTPGDAAGLFENHLGISRDAETVEQSFNVR